MPKQEKKYYLGLDIGIGSVGWAIIGEENGEHWLEDFGVRLFNVPEESKNKKSLAEKRREFRGKRRLLNRWNCRREDLKRYFFTLFIEKHPHIKKDFEEFAKRPTNLLKYDETKFFNPYVIRYQALSGKIELVELLNILLQISKYRGYKSFYLDDNLEEKDEDGEKTKTAVQEVKKLFEENNYRSVAEMIVKNEKFRHSRYQNLFSVHNHNPNKVYENKEEIKKIHKHFIFPREFLEAETKKILEKQSEYYPQLGKISKFKLWENGKNIEKKLSAQEIIRTKIFRQRDFEDGPTQMMPISQNKKEIGHWKKYNRNITFTPFTEATGYCQYFPEERRGWHCSIIYCCFQFINEFSKIGGLELKDLEDLKKVKEVHEKVFDWLLSPSGYQPIILSKEEKKSGKKRETFRKQLEKFLKDKLEVNYNFPKGIEFKIDFLDIIKENILFYSVLWKDCPSRFYLNYETYQKTIFCQIGKIIFEDISPWRRKGKLNEIGKKYSLEPFQNCLEKLEKYDKERSPASVSFNYMIETIKAFLIGQKYGDFQAESKKKLENDLENSKKGNGKKNLWTPWMHPDLVRNPVVFRSFNQTRKILRNLFLSYPQGFATINIETGRDLWSSEEERNKIERKNQDQAKEKQNIVQKLKSGLNIRVNEENIKRYRLWEDQNEKLWIGKNRRKKPTIQETNSGGICLYCGREIDWNKLEDTEIDHIIPQSKLANDSFNNLTLTHRECNQNKGKILTPFQFFKEKKSTKEFSAFKKTVDNLYRTRNAFKHKFLTLGEEEGWERELEDFISRNLNDTRMVATYLVRYIHNEINKDEKFKKTKIQSIKGSITSYFRQQIFDRSSVFYYKDQLRSLTHYHHAIDAIVLAHFKSRGYIQLIEDLTKINRSKKKLKDKWLTKEQFGLLCQEITKKWKRPEWELKKHELFDEYTQNAVEILEDAKQKAFVKSEEISPIHHLKNIVEQRIPIQWEKDFKKESYWSGEENKEIEEVIIEVKGVLTEDKYHERIKNNLEDKRGNIHYPYISYSPDHKVKKNFFASEQAGWRKKGEKILPDICEKLKEKEKIDLPENISLSNLVEKIGLDKLNFEYGKKYNFLIVKKGEGNYTIWDTSIYAGFGNEDEKESRRIKNIELIQKNKSVENYKLFVRPKDIFTLIDSESLEDSLKKLTNLPLFYTGTTGDNVSSIDIVGLVNDNKENLQNIYLERGDKIIKVKNKINSLGTGKKSIKKISSSLELLEINILGKKIK